MTGSMTGCTFICTIKSVYGRQRGGVILKYKEFIFRLATANVDACDPAGLAALAGFNETLSEMTEEFADQKKGYFELKLYFLFA